MVKGLITLLAGAGAKVALVSSAKAVAAFGVAKFLTGAAVVCVVIGGIQWTSERVSLMRDGIDALENGDMEVAVKKFAKLAIKLGISHLDLPDAANAYLLKANLDPDAANAVSEALRGLQDDIAEHMKR